MISTASRLGLVLCLAVAAVSDARACGKRHVYGSGMVVTYAPVPTMAVGPTGAAGGANQVTAYSQSVSPLVPKNAWTKWINIPRYPGANYVVELIPSAGVKAHMEVTFTNWQHRRESVTSYGRVVFLSYEGPIAVRVFGDGTSGYVTIWYHQ